MFNTDIFRYCDKPFNNNWVMALRPNKKIYLVKEKQCGIVNKWKMTNGIVTLTFRIVVDDKWIKQRWQVMPDGTGFDGNQIILPLWYSGKRK